MGNRKTQNKYKNKRKNNKQSRRNKFVNKNKINKSKLVNIKFKVTPEGMKELKKLGEISIINAINEGIINYNQGIELVINPHYTGVSHSNFAKHITNDAIQELEKVFTTKHCIEGDSLYDSMKTVTHNGFQCKILPKGSFLFKTMPAFTTPQMEAEYIKHQPDDKPMWFGQKYISYGYARNNYFGINVYEVTDDIYFLDMNESIGKMIELLKLHLTNDDIEYFKYTMGYDIGAVEQLVRLVKEKAHKWKQLWFFTYPQTFVGSHYYCKSQRKNISPMAVSLRGYKIFFEIFKILHNVANQEGIVVEQVQSYLDNNGIFKHEEFMLSTNTYRMKLRRAHEHPLDWMQWKPKDLDLSNGFILSDSFDLQTAYDNSLVPNEDFKLIRFWQNNITKYPKMKPTDTNFMLSYNIHSFKNINKIVSRDDNIKNILKLVYHFHKHVNVLGFQEVVFNSKEEEIQIKNKLKQWGFQTIFTTVNGLKSILSHSRVAMKLMICLKEHQKVKIIEHVDSKGYSRNSILFNIDGYTGCLTHITIGEPLLVDVDEFKEDNNRITNYNYIDRANQLDGIFRYKPDFIMGDFNLTPDSIEAKYIKEQGYIMINDTKGQSTPYNKVDMIFKRKNSKINLGKYYNIKCNYSDHTPFIVKLK